jgi:hypothetical protein
MSGKGLWEEKFSGTERDRMAEGMPDYPASQAYLSLLLHRIGGVTEQRGITHHDSIAN